MRYLKKFNESHLDTDLINTINDICIELTDLGFYNVSGISGNSKDLRIRLESMGGASIIRFRKVGGFYFSEVSEFLYRIKDVIGIDRIDDFNYQLLGRSDYLPAYRPKIENETLNISEKIGSAYIILDIKIIK